VRALHDFLAEVLERLFEHWERVNCPRCGGGGFSGPGTGYDDVCGECGGQSAWADRSFFARGAS